METSRLLSSRLVGHADSRARPLSGIERLVVGLEIFLGLGAMAGGGLLSLAPDGHLVGMPAKLLAGTPFTSYLIPGLILFTFVGIAPMLAAAATLRRLAIAPLAAVAVGVTLVGWIAVEMVLLAGPASLAWSFYLVLGCSLAALGVARWRSAR